MKFNQRCPKCDGELTLAYKNYRKCKNCGELIKSSSQTRIQHINEVNTLRIQNKLH